MSCTTFDISGELFMIHCVFLLKYKCIPADISIVGIVALSLRMCAYLYRYICVCKSKNGRIYEGVNEQESY